MVLKLLEELGAAVSPENLWKKKESCRYFRFSSKGLIIEELDLFNNFVNFEPTFIHQREHRLITELGFANLLSWMQRKQTDEPYQVIPGD